MIETPSFFKDYQKNYNEKTNAANWFNLGEGFDFKALFFVESATIIFTYDCQYSLVSIYESLEDRSEKKLFTLNNIGMLLIASMALIVSIFGYLTSPTKGYELIIFREDLGNFDYFMSIGKFVIGITITVDISLNHSVLRQSFFETFYKIKHFTTKQ